MLVSSDGARRLVLGLRRHFGSRTHVPRGVSIVPSLATCSDLRDYTDQMLMGAKGNRVILG
jgi:hypothetical protein